MSDVSRFKLVPFDEIVVGSSAVYAVKGLLPRVGVALIYGPYKEGKTFVVLDMLMAVASDRPYRGRRVKGGPVVYIALEGAPGFRRRIEAYRRLVLPPESPSPEFHLVDTTLALVEDVNELISDIKTQMAGSAPAVIAIDTLNRSFVGSESADEAMTAYIRAADALKAAFGCCVVIVHHTGHDKSRPRGHTSLLGAVDASLSVKMDRQDIVMTVEAMKDGPSGDQLAFRLSDEIQVGVDEDGEPLTSCVIQASDRPQGGHPQRETGKGPPKSVLVARAALERAIAHQGVLLPGSAGIPGDVRSVTLDEWRKQAYSEGISSSKEARAREKAFERAVERMGSDPSIHIIDDRVWISNR